MKNLWLGLLPVIIFWFFEEKFGTMWGLVAAVVWAIGECLYEYIRNRTIDKMTFMSTALVVVLGGVSFFLDKSIFFKFQPVITEVLFAGILFWQSRKENSWLFQMAVKSKPEAFKSADPLVQEKQKKMFARMTLSLEIFLVIHAVFLGIVAWYGSTGQWAFWKGVGFYVLFLVWFGVEYLVMRTKSKLK